MATLSALWGASYLFIKVALVDGVAPISIVFSRLALGALVLVPLAVRAGALIALPGRRGPIVLMTLVQVVGPFLLITYGERHIASGLTGILIAAASIFTVLLAMRFAHEERLHGIAALGIVVGLVGVALLFGVDLSGDANALAGGLMVLLAALGYAVGSLYLKARFSDVPTIGLAAWTMIVSTAVLAIPALFALPSETPSLEASASLLVLGAGGTGIAFWIYYALISGVGPSRASLVAYIAPGFAVLYGVWLLDEPLTVGSVVGLVLILAGSWLAAEGRLPGRPRELSRSAPSRSTSPEPAPAPRSQGASSRP
jgi:drug/metabolite transporter (DMT)-like permease